MAETRAGARLTESHRRAQAAVGGRIERQTLAIWRANMDPLNIDATRGNVEAEIVRAILNGYATSANLAAAYTREFKRAETGRPLAARAPVTPSREAIVTTVETQGPILSKVLTERGYSPEAANRIAMLRVASGAARQALVGGRSQVRELVAADPSTAGWRRVGRGETCIFCQMLIGRGEVYSAETVRFASHDNCRCQAEPAFGSGEPINVFQYIASERPNNATERETLRKYLGLAPTDARHAPASGAVPKVGTSFERMSREQLELQVRITEGLKESDWRTAQLARLHNRLAEL